MDTVSTPRKSRLARVFAKIVHVRAATGALENGVQKSKISKTSKKVDGFDEDEKSSLDARAREAFLAKVFAGLSSVKAAYAQLQFAQNPYDSQGIQLADRDIVSELKMLSELKQGYLKKSLNETTMSLETTLLLSEVREQKSLIKTYEITAKKLNSDLRLKDSAITFLNEKLAEENAENRLLENRLSSIEHLAFPNFSRLFDLRPSHFINYFHLAVKSVRAFVRLLIMEMESADWDLEAAASSIVPGTAFWKSSHIGYAFESFVCRHMFDGFDRSGFTDIKNQREVFFDRFVEMRSVSPGDYLAWKPKSAFAQFCQDKYLRVMHPKMEGSIFGNLDQRTLVSLGELPETPFFHAFAEMAMHVWLLRCLALSFDPPVEIFQVKRGNRFSEVYMESLSDEAFVAYDEDPGSGPCVAFIVVPGFKVGAIIVQCQVYLR